MQLRETAGELSGGEREGGLKAEIENHDKEISAEIADIWLRIDHSWQFQLRSEHDTVFADSRGAEPGRI